MTRPPECSAESRIAGGRATDSNIWRLAWAKRDSSRSTGGSEKNPGR
ncbi:MAG: hypothetical protein ACKVU4_14025 [Phycisphaerales bacterium]